MSRFGWPLFSLVWAIGLVGLSSSGCSQGPTYPKERLVASLQELLDREELKTSVRFVDHTLAVHVDYPESLVQAEGQVGLGPAFDKAAHKVLTATHRVLLSTDAQVHFYVLLMSDPQAPGVYLTIVRYLDDVRRANASMLDTPEMFARTIFEMNYMGSEPVTLEQYVPRDIRLEEFLSWQLARRIQSTLTEELQASGAANVGRCGGRFENGEFTFTLDVSPPGGEAALNEETMQQVFQASTEVIAKVLSSYQFDSFEAVRLVLPRAERNLVLPRARLDVFR